MNKIEELIALVQFTLPPPATDENYKDNFNNYFSKYIEGNQTDYENLYYQEDKASHILHRSISLVGRSGAMALYTDIFKQQKNIYTVTMSDYQKYCKYSALGDSHPSLIEEKQDKLSVLHKDIIKSENPKTQDVAEYKSLAKEIQEYNHCCKKITFEALYKVHQIHIDILGRFASFAQDWERDMFFMLTALKSLGAISIDVNEVFKKGKIASRLTNKLKGDGALFCSLCWSDGSVTNNYNSYICVRNTLSHLNHITQCIYLEDKNPFPQPSIIELINKLRLLLAYDLKRQNAVTKSIQDLLLKEHKIRLVLEPEKTKTEPKRFIIQSLETDKIIHLKGKSAEVISTEANDKFMIDLTKELLEFKYPVRK